jgi:hypothetical protein
MEKDPKRKLKKCLLKILSSSSLNLIEIENLNSSKIHSDIDEISTKDLLLFTIPFVIGVYKNSKEEILKYIEIIEETRLFEDRERNNDEFLEKAHANQNNSQKQVATDSDLNNLNSFESGFLMKNLIKESPEYKFNSLKVINEVKSGILNREDKIYMYNRIKEFKIDFIDWGDREYIENLLRICFYKAVIHYRSIITEQQVLKKAESIEEAQKAPTAFTMMPCGHLNPLKDVRKELLKRRINPTMTLDEYADSLMEKMNRIENEEKKDKSIEELREEDDKKDIRKNFRGNTKNIS